MAPPGQAAPLSDYSRAALPCLFNATYFLSTPKGELIGHDHTENKSFSKVMLTRGLKV